MGIPARYSELVREVVVRLRGKATTIPMLMTELVDRSFWGSQANTHKTRPTVYFRGAVSAPYIDTGSRLHFLGTHSVLFSSLPSSTSPSKGQKTTSRNLERKCTAPSEGGCCPTPPPAGRRASPPAPRRGSPCLHSCRAGFRDEGLRYYCRAR